MIAAWMLYCLLCALGLSFAAALAERVLLAGRGPVRVVWVGAVALSLLVPAAALRFASRPGPGDASPDVGQNVFAQILDTAQDASATEPREPQTRGRDWRAMLARLDQPLAVAWVALSIALALNFFAGVATLASMRRRWVRRVVLDVPVFVSERTGPAVVGVVAPSIVLPEWVLAMEPQQLSLMLRHEQEHRRAGDGQLLTGAELALIAMPWNVVLWWQILRLRVAVELDCDARVLRDADASVRWDHAHARSGNKGAGNPHQPPARAIRTGPGLGHPRSARPRESVDAASAARFGAARSADERCRTRDVRREPVAATGWRSQGRSSA